MKKQTKDVILECLDFIKYQVENDKCSNTEMDSIKDFLLRQLDAMATIDEISKYFGQSKSNVSNVLARRFVPSRERERVTRYRFGWFVNIMPSSWLHK